jgi:hypothetical protein
LRERRKKRIKMSNLSEKEITEILNELKTVRPEKLTGEAKRLFEAIMKIADERDELLKERQADKEKIKELEAINKMQEYRINKMDIPIAYVIENRNKIHKEYIEVIEKNLTKAFILKCKLEAYEDLLKDGGE